MSYSCRFVLSPPPEGVEVCVEAGGSETWTDRLQSLRAFGLTHIWKTQLGLVGCSLQLEAANMVNAKKLQLVCSLLAVTST